MWKCGSKSAVYCKILLYNIAKTTSQKSCNSLPSQKLYTITCIIPLFTSRLAAKVKKKETWMVCSLHIQTAMYFQFKTLKVWISLKTMENMASTGAIALSTVTPAPGSHSAALPVGAHVPGKLSWWGLCCRGGALPCTSQQSVITALCPVLLTQSPEIHEINEACAGAHTGEHAVQKRKSEEKGFRERNRGQTKVFVPQGAKWSASRSVMSNSLRPHGLHSPWIVQARILEWVSLPSPGDLPNPGIEPKSPALKAGSLAAEP